MYGPRSCSTTKFSHSSFKWSAIDLLYRLKVPYRPSRIQKDKIKRSFSLKRTAELDDETAAVISLAKALVKGVLVNKFWLVEWDSKIFIDQWQRGLDFDLVPNSWMQVTGGEATLSHHQFSYFEFDSSFTSAEWSVCTGRFMTAMSRKLDKRLILLPPAFAVYFSISRVLFYISRD